MATTTTSAPPRRKISRAELEKNDGANGRPAWILIGRTVYDVSTFHVMHPGGSKILTDLCGGDATEQFWGLHRQEVLHKWGGKLAVGEIEDAEELDEDEIDDLGVDYGAVNSNGKISTIPYAEHYAWMGYETPYYKDSHLEYRKRIRRWVFTTLWKTGIAESHETSGEKPSDALFQEMGQLGILAARLGKGAHLQIWKDQVATGDKTIFGVPIEDFDYFHEAITHEELGSMGCGGFYSGLGDGMVIGLPPVVQFAQNWMKEKVIPEVLSGQKRICLAITEPQAGSDVANIITSAKKTKDGKYYIVNGTKKWITQGHHANYFVMAVRTGETSAGMGGISLLLLERGMKGLRTKPIKTSYSPAAGTALVICENVKVPVENLIGEENGGFMCIMYNFNHERWYIIVYILNAARKIIEECFKWCMQRRAFRKRLMDQGVVRMKMATMMGALEPCSHWLDSITHQMNNMDYSMQAMRLAGTTSLLKFQSTRAAAVVADNSVQLLGGRGITQTGMGRYVERFNVGYKFAAILGGSEEIMADLAIKMAMRSFPKEARL